MFALKRNKSDSQTYEHATCYACMFAHMHAQNRPWTVLLLLVARVTGLVPIYFHSVTALGAVSIKEFFSGGLRCVLTLQWEPCILMLCYKWQLCDTVLRATRFLSAET